MTYKNVLIVSSTASMIQQFNQRNIKSLQNLGYRVFVATNFSEPGTISPNAANQFFHHLKEQKVIPVQTNFKRGLGGLISNVNAYRQLRQLMNTYHFEFVHSQSPIGGVIARIAAWRNKIPNLYMVHGFHFFKNGPKLNWIILPVEKLLSRITEAIVTINDEDYQLAKRALHAKRVYEVDGPGRNLTRDRKYLKEHGEKDRREIRHQFNIPNDAALAITVAELSNRKNHLKVIEAFSLVNDPKLYYLIIGIGDLHDQIEDKIKQLNLQNNIILAGYHKKTSPFYAAGDFSILASTREGLAQSGIEALNAKLPLVGSNIRGINSYLVNDMNGYLVDPNDPLDIADKIKRILKKTSREKMVTNTQKSVNKYDYKLVEKQMLKVYKSMQ